MRRYHALACNVPGSLVLRMMTRHILNPLAALAATLLMASSAAAQVVVLPLDIDGDLPPEDEALFVEALEAGLAADGRASVVGQDETAAELGDLAACADSSCAAEIGQTIPGQVAVRASVYAEAEIYDFTITIYDLNSGDSVTDQVGDCTFCPVAEAVDSFQFTAQAALGGVAPMPAATTPGADTVATTEPDPVESPDPVPAEDAALIEGDISFSVSAEPDDAEIRINGQLVGTGRADLDLAPQELDIVIIADGHSEYQEDVRLTETMVGPIFLRAQLAPEPIVEQRPARTRNTSESSFNRRSVGGVMAGVGGAAMIGGIVMLAIDGNSTCESGPLTACEEVYETTAGGVALSAVGAVATGIGLGFIITSFESSDAGSDSAERGSTLSVRSSRRGAVVNWEARF